MFFWFIFVFVIIDPDKAIIVSLINCLKAASARSLVVSLKTRDTALIIIHARSSASAAYP